MHAATYFAGAVPEDRGGLNAPRQPHSRQCVFDRERRGLRVEGPIEQAGIACQAVARRPHDRQKRPVQHWLEQFRALVKRGAERGLCRVQSLAHIRVLGTLAREQECNAWLAGRVDPTLRDARGIAVSQPRAEGRSHASSVRAEHGQSMWQLRTAHVGGVRNICKVFFGMGRQVVLVAHRQRAQRRFRGGRQGQQLARRTRPSWRSRLEGGRLLQDDVGIRAAEAERAHAGQTRRVRSGHGMSVVGTCRGSVGPRDVAAGPT